MGLFVQLLQPSLKVQISSTGVCCHEAHPNKRGALPASTHIGSALAVLGSQVQASADAAARVGHDAQAGLQDGSHHSNVGAMPQQLPVCKLVVLGKPLCFPAPLNLPHIEKLQMAGCCLQA